MNQHEYQMKRTSKALAKDCVNAYVEFQDSDLHCLKTVIDYLDLPISEAIRYVIMCYAIQIKSGELPEKKDLQGTQMSLAKGEDND